MAASDWITLAIAVLSFVGTAFGLAGNRKLVKAQAASEQADAASTNVTTALKLRDEIQKSLSETLERLNYLENADDRKDAELSEMRLTIHQQETRLRDQARRITELEELSRHQAATIEGLKKQLSTEKARVTRLRELLQKHRIDIDTGEL